MWGAWEFRFPFSRERQCQVRRELGLVNTNQVLFRRRSEMGQNPLLGSSVMSMHNIRRVRLLFSALSNFLNLGQICTWDLNFLEQICTCCFWSVVGLGKVFKRWGCIFHSIENQSKLSYILPCQEIIYYSTESETRVTSSAFELFESKKRNVQICPKSSILWGIICWIIIDYFVYICP